MWEAHDDAHERADADHGEAAHAEEHEHEGEHADSHHDADEDHAHGEIDMHIWLDPSNAKVLVPAIATALSDADPGNASTYQANAARLGQRLDEINRYLQRRLALIADRPYVVFHDAYQYFEG
jgi:zinc transport system substrate-binding protein